VTNNSGGNNSSKELSWIPIYFPLLPRSVELLSVA